MLVQITMIPTPEQTKEIKKNSLKFNQSKLKLLAMFIAKLQRVSDNAHSALHRASGITPSETFRVLPYR